MSSSHRYVLLSLATAAYFLTLFSRMVLGPVVPDIIAALDVSKGLVGLAFTCMWGAYALLQYPGGVLADRYGEKTLIVASIGSMGVASALLAVAPTYAVFLVVAAVVGATSGLYPPAGVSILTKRFTGTGQALGLHVAGANLAGLVAPVAAAYVAVRIGWRGAPLLTFLAAVPLVVLIATRIRPTEPSDPGASMRSQFTVTAVASVVSRPSIAFTMFVGAIGIFAFNAIASFLPTFLIESRGLDTVEAGTAFGVVYLFSAMVMPIMGRASDYVNRDYAIMASLSVVTVGLGLLLFGAGVVPLLVTVAVLGSGISWAGALASRYMDHLDASERGSGYGLARTITGLVGSLGSVVVGTVADAAGWLPAYGVVVGLLVIATVALGANRLLSLGW